MLNLIVENIRTKIEGDLPYAVSKVIDHELSYQVEGYFFDPRYKAHVWDGKVHRYSTQSQRFDTGCLTQVCCILQDHSQQYTVVDKRIAIPPGTPLAIHNAELRPYQNEALDAVFANKRSRGLFLMCTGSGKSLIICALAGRLNLRTVIYVHTIDLLEQMKDNISKHLNIEAGQVGDGIVDIKHFTVAMMQTTCKALTGKYVKYEFDPDSDYDDPTILDAQQKQKVIDMVGTAQVMVVDESHHLSCSSLQTIVKHSKQAYYRFGASATMREDGADILIHGATGPVIYKITASELIEMPAPGPYLVPPTIYYYYVGPHPSGLLRGGTYNEIYKNNIVERQDRNKLIVNATLKFCSTGKNVLILVKQIKHGKILLDMFESGIASDWDEKVTSDQLQIEFLQGRVCSDDRKKYLKAFKEKRLNVLIATSLADEGLDLPCLDAVILAGGGKSYVKAFQRVGRALRLYPGKTKAYVIDFFDDSKHLRKHTNRRIKLFKQERAFTIKIQKK